jgi:methionine-rich copper-binding protein CopC
MDRPDRRGQAQERQVILRRLAIASLAVLLMAATSLIAVVHAQGTAGEVRVLESTPAAHAHIGRKGTAFFVRFDRPVDHRKSTLLLKQGDKVIERLHPRLESAPDVLFAAAPTLPSGDYTLHWAVITLQGTKAIEGDIPFKVSDRPPQ